MSRRDTYNPNDFNPSESIKSRYAKKVVNNKYYSTFNITTGTITQVVMDSISYNFAIRNYDHYKDRNPWMAHNYLKAAIEYIEREIKRKHCE